MPVPTSLHYVLPSAPSARSNGTGTPAHNGLHTRPPADLYRAQCHHRRALRALQGEAYASIDATTRRRLIVQLKADLAALRQAIDALPASDAMPSTATSACR